MLYQRDYLDAKGLRRNGKPCLAEGNRSRTDQRMSDTPYWV
jgi:hypothetical protein